MARTEVSVPFLGVTLPAGTPITVISVKAAANINLLLRSLDFWFNDTDGSHEGILIELIKITTDGTGTAVSPVVTNLSQCTIQCTVKKDYSVEPSVFGDLVKPLKIHPQTGMVYSPPVDGLIIPNNTIWGLRMTAVNSCDVSGALHLEE